MPPRAGGVTTPGRYETQDLPAAPERQDIRPAADDALVWRCPRCSRICNRILASEVHDGMRIEHKCKCNAISTATVSLGRLLIRRGGLQSEGGDS